MKKQTKTLLALGAGAAALWWWNQRKKALSGLGQDDAGGNVAVSVPNFDAAGNVTSVTPQIVPNEPPAPATSSGTAQNAAGALTALTAGSNVAAGIKNTWFGKPTAKPLALPGSSNMLLYGVLGVAAVGLVMVLASGNKGGGNGKGN